VLKGFNSQIEGNADSSVPEISVSETGAKKEGYCSLLNAEGDDGGTMALMLKSSRIFKELLKRADEERAKKMEGS
jgi:hypothetical protein